MATTSGRHLTRRQVARAFDVDVRTVAKWIDGGMPIALPGGPGRAALFSLPDCVNWRVEEQLAARGADPDALSAQTEQALLNRTRRAELELKLQVRRGELVELDEVLREQADCAVAVKAKLRRIPDAIAERLVTAAKRGPAHVKVVLLNEIDQALRELARSADEEPEAEPCEV
jgi:phage terminase Nu1 subunit (DNA packaging protein)